MLSWTHKHKTDLMTDSDKQWGLCLSFASSISTICIPSLQLPQPIQAAAILNRATHARLPTEGHYCAPWPRLSPSKQSNRHNRKKTAVAVCVPKGFSLDSEKLLFICTGKKYERVEKNITDPPRCRSQMFVCLPWASCPVFLLQKQLIFSQWMWRLILTLL